MSRRWNLALALSSLFFAFGSWSSRADFLNPVEVVFVSTGAASKDALIDDANLSDPPSPSSIHPASAGKWTSAAGSIRQEIIVDLGDAYSLTQIYLWNFQGDTTIGLKDVEIQTSPDSDYTTAHFTAVATVSLTEGGEEAQTFDITATDARLVRLRILSNWGQGFTVGLGALRFETGTIAGHVPAVSILSPAQGDTLTVGANVVLSAKVEDADNDIAKVEFFDGTDLLGTVVSAPYSFTVAGGFKFGDHEIRAVATDKTGKVGWFSVDVSARENTGGKIIQIDDNADIGDGINQISYSPGWNLAPGDATDPRFNHNDHYSFTKDSYFEVKFFGTKIDIYSTVASHHGLGSAQIDGGDPVDISYAAEQRGEQKFIWGSPTLPNREHVLRVTVKSGAVVTADRFDVTVPDTTITQIDDNADIGDGVNQITYSSGWNLAPGDATDPRFNHNDHYSFTKDSYFEVKFFGFKIEIYSTVASHHGLGSAQIDDGEPVDISYAAQQRGEQKFIWSSPVLPNRVHILRVTVKSGAVVTADRFDVFSSSAGGADLAGVSKVIAKPGSFQIDFKDFGTSLVDAATMQLSIDGKKVSSNPTKTLDTTTLLYTPTSAFLPGSQHTYAVSGHDTIGNALTTQGTFTIPVPPFPLTGLAGPKGTAGNWGFRTVWKAGLVNNLDGAVVVAGKSAAAVFGGKFQDTTVPLLNLGESTNPRSYGLFQDDIPLPAEAVGVTANDFVVIAHGYVKIPIAGDWTIGVHSDEGFALRFIGAPFESVSGLGLIDPSYPEYMFNGNNTTDSNTRGILRNLDAGVYEIEFLGWERTGVAHYEVYAANGAYSEDADTEDWKLVGDAEGLALVDRPKVAPAISSIKLNNGNVVITFTSSADSSAHQLLESSDLTNWKVSANAVIVKGAGGVFTATVVGGAGGARYYRLSLP